MTSGLGSLTDGSLGPSDFKLSYYPKSNYYGDDGGDDGDDGDNDDGHDGDGDHNCKCNFNKNVDDTSMKFHIYLARTSKLEAPTPLY